MNNCRMRQIWTRNTGMVVMEQYRKYGTACRFRNFKRLNTVQVLAWTAQCFTKEMTTIRQNSVELFI
jgi:hypothetical protein